MVTKVGTTAHIAGRAPDECTSDAMLITLVARGDLGAFERLYRCYFPRLTRFLERMTRRPRLVEEVLNDTMLVVWRKANTYDGSSQVSTWVFAIAYRKALKAIKNLDEPVAENLDVEEAAAAWEAGPESQLRQKQMRTMLGQVMKSLSADQRAVVELTYYHGYSYPEIAAIMDCPVDTVKTRMFYARRRLKTLLADRKEV